MKKKENPSEYAGINVLTCTMFEILCAAGMPNLDLEAGVIGKEKGGGDLYHGGRIKWMFNLSDEFFLLKLCCHFIHPLVKLFEVCQ